MDNNLSDFDYHSPAVFYFKFHDMKYQAGASTLSSHLHHGHLHHLDPDCPSALVEDGLTSAAVRVYRQGKCEITLLPEGSMRCDRSFCMSSC